MGQGYTMDEATKEVKMVVEGIYSAKAALALGKKYNVRMPIIEEVNKVLFEDKPAKDAVLELMKREKILLNHTEKYKIWLADDGRWKTKIPDGSKYGKLVARATKENLENFIVDFYKAKEETDKITMATIYPNFLEYKYLSSEKGTANKL